MIYIRKIKKPKNRLRVITVYLLIFSILFCYCYTKMQPVIMTYAVSVAETKMLQAANTAAINILESNSISYNDIVNLSNNGEGYVTSLEINAFEVNRLKGLISNETTRIVDNEEYYKVSIPIGTFFGNVYTSGLGPKLNFNMQLTCTAFVDFSHEFKSAGINQVLHIINVNISIRGNLLLIGYNKGINVKTSSIAAQTVIVGKTPDAFTNVIESESDNTGGLINDYGAIAE